MTKQLLDKIRIAKERTRQWALGVNVKFPQEFDSKVSYPELTLKVKKRKKKRIYYPNCSELLADFEVQDPKVMFDILSNLIKKYSWKAEPQPTVKFLEDMKKDREVSIYLVDNRKNEINLQYGDNGYDDTLTYWLALPGNNDWDEKQYPFMAAAKDEAGAVIKIYDGGHIEGWDSWYGTHWSELERLIKEARIRHEKKI